MFIYSGQSLTCYGVPDMPSEPGMAHAERRQITVAFVDLAGSTELSSRLDPEDFRNLILAYQETVSAAVNHHDGYIARLFGDGMLIYFGYPRARENDAERAVQAGLDIVDAVGSIDLDQRIMPDGGLGVRIGVMTGPSVVGDIVGQGAAQESTVLGEMPNIAARLQSIAQPNQLVIGDTTKDIVEGLFEFEDLGHPQLKGVGRPVQSFRVSGATGAHGRFGRSLSLGLTQLVGRRSELEELQQSWEDAEVGCITVAVIGDAGIGKSRLIHEFCEHLGREQAFFLRGHCVIGGETSPLHPFVELVRTAFQIHDNDADLEQKIERGLDILGLPAREHLPYLLNLFGHAPAELREMPAELLGSRTRRTLQQLFRARCARSRVLVNIEDLHWSDRLSEELLGWLLEQQDFPGLLVLVSYRPEYRAPWKHLPGFRPMELTPLSPHNTGDLVRLRLGDAIPDEVIKQVTARAEGNPLFAEEMANYLVRNEDKHAALGTLPANLESLLLDRIDRLESAPHTVLQAASVIGRRFSMESLARISQLNGKLAPCLKILETQDLVYPESKASRFRFKHALVRDVVYQNLLRADRKILHLRLAQSLESDYSARIDEVVDEIADHYAHTERVDKTVAYLALAGEKSLALYSLDAAEARFQHALDLMREHPGCADEALLARVLLKLARVYYFQYEFRKLIGMVDEYLPRIEALGDPRVLSRFLFETGYAHVFGAQQAIGKPLLERALEVAETVGDDEGIGYASMGLIWHHAFWGTPGPDRRETLECLGERAFGIARHIGDVWLESKTMLALANEYMLWGDLAKGRYWDDKLGQLARESDDPRPLGLSLFRRAYGTVYTGDFEVGIDYAEEALKTSISPIDRAYGQLALAFCQLMAGRLAESSEALVRLRKEMEAKGMLIVNFLATEVAYSFMLLMRGDLALAVRHLDGQMKRFSTLGQATAPAYGHLYLGQIHVILATNKERPTWDVVKRNLLFLLRTIPFADRRARAYLQQALDEARELDIPAVELLALVQLVTLHRARGRETEATACLETAQGIAPQIGGESLLAPLEVQPDRNPSADGSGD